METVLNYGLSGVVAFGAVGVISRFTNLTSEIKLGLLVVIAFAVGFIPADLGNELFNRAKDAIGVGLGIHALWSTATRIGGK